MAEVTFIRTLGLQQMASVVTAYEVSPNLHLERDADRVRLITRGGYNSADR
jgi:hypothetical protein